MPVFDNFVCCCGSGMIESMLEPHMKNEAGLTQTGKTLFNDYSPSVFLSRGYGNSREKGGRPNLNRLKKH